MASNQKIEQRIEELQSGDVKTRRKAARWLGRKGTYETSACLLSALKDKNWTVRLHATVALGKIGDVEAVEPLIEQLSDHTVSVKRAAIHALGSLRDARATEGLAILLLLEHLRLSDDALNALVQIGAPALLHCCHRLENDDTTPPVFWQQTMRKMVSRGGDPLLKEMLCAEGWNGRQRWLILETLRTAQSSLSFFDVWRLSRFSRVTDIPVWCERIARDPEQSTLHGGIREILDYIMLGRASQRDFATESIELLRAADGTKSRDTGATLLRASDQSEEMPVKFSFLSRLRRWLAARGRKVLP